MVSSILQHLTWNVFLISIYPGVYSCYECWFESDFSSIRKEGLTKFSKNCNKHYSLISLFIFTYSSTWEQNTQLRKIHKNLLPNDSSSLSNENIFKDNISKVKHIYEKIMTIPPNLYTNNTGSISIIISRKEETHLILTKSYLVVFNKIACVLWYQSTKTKLV